MFAALVVPGLAEAQIYFTDTGNGDVNAGFRKTGTYQEKYEMVVYLGNINYFVGLTPGTQINITNYTHQQLTNMCPDNLGNLQWSVFSSFGANANRLTNSLGVFAVKTCFYTVPRTNVSVQTTPVARFPVSSAGDLESHILGVSTAANAISQEDLTTTNVYNNTLVVLEPVSLDPRNLLTALIGNTEPPANPAFGDFGGLIFNTWTVENVTPPVSPPPSFPIFMSMFRRARRFPADRWWIPLPARRPGTPIIWVTSH